MMITDKYDTFNDNMLTNDSFQPLTKSNGTTDLKG